MWSWPKRRTTTRSCWLASRWGALLFPAYGNVIRRIGPGRRLFEAHRRIFEALEAGDAESAQEWMTKHFVDFKRGCELAGLDLDDPVAAPQQTTRDA